MLRRLRRALKREDGQALVELALVLPILLMLVLGIVDFGRAVNYWNGETSLANATARFVAVGALPTSGTCANKANVTLYMTCALSSNFGISTVSSGNGLRGMNYCVSVPSNQAGQPVTVKIYGSYQWLPIFKTTSGPWNLHMTGSATLPLENTVASTLYTTSSPCPTPNP